MCFCYDLFFSAGEVFHQLNGCWEKNMKSWRLVPMKSQNLRGAFYCTFLHLNSFLRQLNEWWEMLNKVVRYICFSWTWNHCLCVPDETQHIVGCKILRIHSMIFLQRPFSQHVHHSNKSVTVNVKKEWLKLIFCVAPPT